MTQKITGREPRLSILAGGRGTQKLSLRRLATMLNVLPPEAISLDAAAEMIKSEEFYVRYNAAKLLSRRADREARLIMQDALSNGEAPTRASVARHLYGFSWFAAEPMIRQALHDKDQRVREMAIYALCDLRELNAYQLMTEVLKVASDDLRWRRRGACAIVKTRRLSRFWKWCSKPKTRKCGSKGWKRSASTTRRKPCRLSGRR